VEKEMRRFRRTQETRVRSFQAEVREGLSPFRGRKLFPEPEIDDDAILPPIIKSEPRHDDDHHLHHHQPPHLHQQDQACSVAVMDVAEAPPPAIGASGNGDDTIILD
jgi:hypothetical protein